LATSEAKHATDWSSDGRFLLFRNLTLKTDWDIWAMPVSEDRKAFPVVQTNFEERDGQFSPDGKWIAYQSNESGRFEIYVQPFPAGGEKVRISNNGGAQARWRRCGKECFIFRSTVNSSHCDSLPQADLKAIRTFFCSPRVLVRCRTSRNLCRVPRRPALLDRHCRGGIRVADYRHSELEAPGKVSLERLVADFQAASNANSPYRGVMLTFSPGAQFLYSSV
jgi:hypothetical protein